MPGHAKVVALVAIPCVFAACTLGALDGLSGPGSQEDAGDAAAADTQTIPDATVDAPREALADGGQDACKIQGPRASAGAGQYIVVAGGVPWTNYVSGAKDSDNDRATAELHVPDGTLSHFLAVGDFGFTIPTGATVRGVEIAIEHSVSGDGVVKDEGVLLVKPGVSASNVARTAPGFWTKTDTVVTYGGPTDTWGFELSPADVNSAGFAIYANARIQSGSATIAIDQVRVSIHYCE